MRKILPSVTGLVGAFVVIHVLESVLHGFYPEPPGTDLNNPDTFRRMMDSLPAMAFVWLLLIYAAASLTGGLVATLLSGRSTSRPAVTIGAALTIAGGISVLAVYHPTWFRLASVFVYIPFAYAGFRASKK